MEKQQKQQVVEQIVVKRMKLNIVSELTRMLMIMRWTPNQIDELVDEFNQKTSVNGKFETIVTKTFFDILEKSLGQKIDREKPIDEKIQKGILEESVIDVMEQIANDLKKELFFEKKQEKE